MGERDVLLCGEPGAGKRTLAERMRQGDEPLVVVDCRAGPAVLLESVLFGHMRSNCWGGGGPTVNAGVFELAGDGLVVLDELAAIPPDLYPKLARALATRQVRRIGGNTAQTFAARVVATTAEPERLSATLRAELVETHVPPVRERCGALLAELGVALAADQVARLEQLALDIETLARVAVALDCDAAITELELLEAIARTPDDDTPRLVYADWLAQHGDPRGELIHVQCALAAQAGHARARRRLRATAQRLLAAHAPAWLAPVLGIPHVTRATLRRGFVDAVDGPGNLVRSLDMLVRVAPTLAELRITDEPPCELSPKLLGRRRVVRAR